MDQLKRQLDAESRQLGDEDEIKANVATAEAELEEAQNQFRSLDIDNRLKRLGNDLASKEHELKTIQDEMAVANSLAETRARYGLKNTEKQRKEQTLQKLVDESVVEFETVFGRKIPADRLESEVSSALRTKQRDIESAREQVNKANQELSSCETRMTMHKKKLKDLEAELAEATAKFVSVVPGFRSVDQYDEKLKESEHKVNDFRDVIGSWSGMERSYRKFLKYVQEKHRCAVCMRAVPENEAENVVKSIQTQLEQMPVNKEGIQEDLEIAEEELAELHAVLPVRERYVKLQQTLIPDVQRDLADAERAKNEAVASLDGFEKVLGDYEAAEKSGHGLKRKAEEASRLRKELRLLDEETSKLKTELESAGSAGTGEELREQQSVKQTEIDKVRKEMADANRNARTKQAEIQAKTSRYRDAKEKSDAFQVRQEKQKRLKEDIATLQQDNADKETNIRKMEIEIDEQRPKMIDLESRLQELRQQQANREADANKEVGKLAQSQNRLQAYDKEIQRYHDEGVADRLHDVDLKLKKRETDLLGTQADLQSIAEEASRLDKRTSEEAVERRNIEDNLRLRKLKRDLVSTNRELEKLKGERTDLDKGTLNQQFQRLKAKQDKLVEERAHIMGELKQLEERQRQIQNQLSTDFKNVEKQYSEQLISLKTKEMAHVDLEKYAKALDIAIMKYHSMKMDEINKIIKELWQKTYKGNDIQTIEIRADAESAKGNRSYNYRVVMVKETTELDMRGRCSAGQKVLTALIIRLALAETFCINCGVLALDEPTTNLDHENMMSLAQSLADIIEDRKKQANFQLIVITHDEDFMRALGASNHADYFFRIEKDEQWVLRGASGNLRNY